MGEPSLTIISLIARMRQPSCPTNPIISIIPFLQIPKNPFYFLISSFFKLRKNSQSPNLPFILSRFNSSFDQRNLDRRGDLFHRPWTTSRPRRGSFSSFSHPARGYDALRILEGRGRSSSATEEKKGRGEIAIGRRRTGHDIVDESRRSSSSSWLDRLVMSLNISVFEEHELPQMTSTHPRPRRLLLLLLLHETFYLSRSPPPPPRVSLGIQGQVGSLQLARGSWRIRDSSFEEIYGAAWSW